SIRLILFYLMSITLIIPCYNEIVNIQKGVLDKVGNFVKNDDRFVEVLIVDDGSTDKTVDKIRKSYIAQNPKFRLIENAHQGKAFAVLTGIKEAKGEYVLFSDFDLATPLEESEKLIARAVEGAEIIIGSRSGRRKGAPLLRRIMAVGWITLRSLVIGLPSITDTQCGFKMYKTAAARDIVERMIVYKNGTVVHGPSVSAGFDLEMLFIGARLGYRLEEVHVIWRHAASKRVTFFRDSVRGLEDLYAFKIHLLKGDYNFS
ncbi:MAG: glycosyltransferase, partial [Candidatus Roizmanbacteria bacterium]